jgi:hypothetical protein
MKSFAKSLFLSALVFPLLLAGCDAELSPAAKFRAKIDGYAVDLAGAIQIAGGAVSGGVVIDAEYDDDRWEVEVVSGELRTRVKVDPMTGVASILSDRAATAEELEAAALVGSAHVLRRGARRREGGRSGRAALRDQGRRRHVRGRSRR